MTDNFKILSEADYDKLKDAISLITVYIAGADDNIDDDELEWAEKVTSIRSYNLPEKLNGFYEDVGVDFHDRVEKYIASLSDIKVRNSTVEQKLTELNSVLAMLEPKLGAALYSSYISFAKHVAKASGGFLGFFSIGPAEKEILDLKMLTPIVVEEDDSTE